MVGSLTMENMKSYLQILLAVLLMGGTLAKLSKNSPGSVNSINKLAKPKDCQDLWDQGSRYQGVYDIYPNGTYKIQAYCSHTSVGTGTVIQRRINGDESFYRNWQDYKNGFGNLQRDYWMGLEAIHHLTYTGRMKLEIQVQDWSYNTRTNTYEYVIVGAENQGYWLNIGRAFGQLVDDMNFSNNTRFATFDHPDAHSCAINQKAGWWYNYCSYALLNGVYHYGGKYVPTTAFYDGIYWKDWYGYDYSLKYVTMTLQKRY